jgi:hypothetical protein
LGQEFEKLDNTLGPFMELTGEGRPDFKVRSISSSEFYLFLAALPGLALTLSMIVESLLSSYEKIKGIRDKAAGLEDEGVPSEVIERLRDHANERMNIDIDALANELAGMTPERPPTKSRRRRGPVGSNFTGPPAAPDKGRTRAAHRRAAEKNS